MAAMKNVSHYIIQSLHTETFLSFPMMQPTAKDKIITVHMTFILSSPNAGRKTQNTVACTVDCSVNITQYTVHNDQFDLNDHAAPTSTFRVSYGSEPI